MNDKILLRLRHRTEYILLRLVAGTFCLLPYRAALCLGYGIAWCGFYILRFRVKEAKRRIREIFAERFSEKEINGIAWKSWRNFIFTYVETLRIPVSSRDWLENVVDVHDSNQKLFQWPKTGRGGIIATGHIGSWEMAALIGKAYDVPLFSIAGAQRNKLVDNFLNRSRATAGFESVIRNASVVKEILRRIRKGKMLAILPDVRGKTDALAVKFLGKKANIAGGMGFIARQTNVPVFPVIMTRAGWGQHRFRFFEPIFPDPHAEKKADALRITQSFFDILTRCVNAEPEQWFWFNKRWIFEPLEPAIPLPEGLSWN